MFLDFGLATAKEIPKLLNEYVHYYNNKQPAAALGHKSPVQHKAELPSKTMVFLSVYFSLTDALCRSDGIGHKQNHRAENRFGAVVRF